MQYVQFLPDGGGINVVSPQSISLTVGDTSISLSSSGITMAGAVDANGASISSGGEISDALGVTLGTHDHTPGLYVAPTGGGPITGVSGPPVP
jgi:hypothetical protein